MLVTHHNYLWGLPDFALSQGLLRIKKLTGWRETRQEDEGGSPHSSQSFASSHKPIGQVLMKRLTGADHAAEYALIEGVIRR